MSGHGHSESDLGPLPYGKEPRDMGVFWVGQAIVVVFGAIFGSLLYFDLTHHESALRPIMIAVLAAVAVLCLVLFLMNIGKKRSQTYEHSGRFAFIMFLMFLLALFYLLLLVLVSIFS